MRRILVSLVAITLTIATLTPHASAQAQSQRNSADTQKFRKARRPLKGEYIVVFKRDVARSAVASLRSRLTLGLRCRTATNSSTT